MFKLVLLSLLMSTYLLSSVGIIYSIKGKATLNRDGEMIIPSKNFQLEKNDTIRTGDGSSARIKFNDNTLVTLGKNSAVNIADYVFDENNQTNSRSNLNFFKGSFKSITGKIGKLNPSAFKLKTKTASIGIRGTIVLGNQNKIMCTQGAVEVTVAGQTVVIPQGTKTLTIPGQAPIQEAIKPQDIEEFDNAMPIEEEQTQETTDNNDQKEDNQDEQNSEQNTDSEKEESTVQENDKQTTNNEQNTEATTETTSEETSTENVATQQTTNENSVIVNTEAITNVETLTESTTETTNTVEKINEVDTQTNNSGTSTSDSSSSTSSSTANTDDPETTTTPATLEWNTHLDTVTQNVQNELDTTNGEVQNNVLDSTNVLTYRASMLVNRIYNSTTVLEGGSILIAGGTTESNIYLSSTEIYDPYRNNFTLSSPLNTSRRLFSMSTLIDGNAIAIGGQTTGSVYLNSVELFNPTLNTWSYVNALNTQRAYHTSITLSDGNVIAIGGISGPNQVLSSVEKYDYDNDTWSYTGSLNTARANAVSAILNDGSVLIIGGFDVTFLTSVEKYNPSTELWSSNVASLNVPRGFGHSGTTLNDGTVIVFGGLNQYTVERYNPDENIWQYQVSLPNWDRKFLQSSAEILPNGNVLLIGGTSSNGETYEYNTSSTPNSVSNFDQTISNKTNEGYFIGYENSDKSNRVVGAIESMLFNAQDSNIDANSGELNGNIDNEFLSDSSINFNTKTSWMKFVQMDGTEITSSYTSEDDNLILGQAQTTINGQEYILDIGFQTLKDRVESDNSLSSLDDGSSWGYWQAVDEGTSIDYHGWWVSGDSNIDADYIANLISSNTTLSYVGHILGDTFTSSGLLDPIVLDSNNSLHMNIDFGSGNPVDITKMTFNTQQGWQYSNTAGFTTDSSTLDSVNKTINGVNYTVTDVIANVSNATDSLSFDGQLYGLEANSVGGVVGGSIQGLDGTIRDIQGIFKAAKQ